jgi:hypothetical protein
VHVKYNDKNPMILVILWLMKKTSLTLRLNYMMSVISPHVYENDTYEEYLDGQLSEEDIHYLEVK